MLTRSKHLAHRPARRRLLLETLESRSLLAGVDITISDATAIEGGNALKSLDHFVQDASGGLTRPRASTFGPDGNGDGAPDLYVPSADTDQVLRYDGVTGAFLDVFVPAGSGGLDSPGDLEFTSNNLLYVTSNLGRQLLRYDSTNGNFLDVVASGLANPLGVSQGPAD